MKRARQAVAIRQRGAAETARHEREITVSAKIERINHARAFQEQVEERLGRRQCALRTQIPFGQVHRGRHALKHAIYGNTERDSAAQGLPARPQPDNETLTIGDLLGLFAIVHPKRQRASPPQRALHLHNDITSPSPIVSPNRPSMNAEVNLSKILEFLHNMAGQARGAAGGE